MDIKKIGFSHYKCFQEETFIESPSLVNLIIGKNNSGKSTFLSVIDYIFNAKEARPLSSHDPSIEVNLQKEEIEKVFRSYIFIGFSGSHNPETDSEYAMYGKNLVGNHFKFSVNRNSGSSSLFSVNFDNNQDIVRKHSNISDGSWLTLVRVCAKSIPSYNVVRIASERDIKPERKTDDHLINEKGGGITNVIDHFINDVGQDFNLIKKGVLDDINQILEGEDKYTDIAVLGDKDGNRSIYLFENGARIALDEMGSGLKTIFFVILQFHLNEDSPKKSLFMFEELENNLHPEIQRRLFNYIYDFAEKHKTPVYLTSHSHVAINCFFGKEDTSVYHIFKENGSSKIEKVESSLEKVSILNDLGVLASDIFQTNGIIWVEGPSDRVYIKKWISLIDSKLTENVDYSFLYYGGKLLAHYSADSENDLIDLLLTNRNSAIVMDSDKTSEDDKINDTKCRIVDQFSAKGLFYWVTEGREIENYLSPKRIETTLASNEKPITVGDNEKFSKFADFIEPTYNGFVSEKVVFAEKMAEKMDQTDLDVLDLKSEIGDLVVRIRKWNGN